jgi:hypothetical protein
MHGLTFLSNRYSVDFYCAELRLAIEIDGDSHAPRAQYDADLADPTAAANPRRLFHPSK